MNYFNKFTTHEEYTDCLENNPLFPSVSICEDHYEINHVHYLPIPKALKFTSEINGSKIGFYGRNVNLQKSTDGTNWETWDGSKITLNAENFVYIRGNNSAGFGGDKYFEISGAIRCEGNIMHLINYISDLTTIPTNGCFKGLFWHCTGLLTPPELPAVNLKELCYCEMFEYCSGLQWLPDLPATKLKRSCYSAMFHACGAATTCSRFDATILAESCCARMFDSCSSLTSVPPLLATVLPEECYNSMFRYCTSLEIAPEIHAETISERCCVYMFANCSNLKQAPSILAANTLYSECYAYMFQNCSNLLTVPELPGMELAVDCYRAMFDGCTALPIAQTTLPATTLMKACYAYMFRNCSALTAAPILPAETLISQCYELMFNGCGSLKHIQAKFLTRPSSTYTKEWMSGVSYSGTFDAHKDETWSDESTPWRGESTVPDYWRINKILE